MTQPQGDFVEAIIMHMEKRTDMTGALQSRRQKHNAIHGIAAKLAKFSLEINLVEGITHWHNSLTAVMASPSLMVKNSG